MGKLAILLALMLLIPMLFGFWGATVEWSDLIMAILAVLTVVGAPLAVILWRAFR